MFSKYKWRINRLTLLEALESRCWDPVRSRKGVLGVELLKDEEGEAGVRLSLRKRSESWARVAACRASSQPGLGLEEEGANIWGVSCLGFVQLLFEGRSERGPTLLQWQKGAGLWVLWLPWEQRCSSAGTSPWKAGEFLMAPSGLCFLNWVCFLSQVLKDMVVYIL